MDPLPKLQNYYKLQTPYSITLNPVDRYQYHGFEDRYQKFRRNAYSRIASLKQNLMLYIEISEPHQMILQGKAGPRLHMHGTIQFDNKDDLRRFLLSGLYLLTRWTSVDIDTIADPKIWLRYMTKQRLLQKPRLI